MVIGTQPNGSPTVDLGSKPAASSGGSAFSKSIHPTPAPEPKASKIEKPLASAVQQESRLSKLNHSSNNKTEKIKGFLKNLANFMKGVGKTSLQGAALTAKVLQFATRVIGKILGLMNSGLQTASESKLFQEAPKQQSKPA